MPSAEDFAELEALASFTIWGSLDALCAPDEPPPAATGAGPVRTNTHADAVFALRQFETAVTMLRQHVEDRPRDDLMMDLHADLVLEALVVAGGLISRFRDLREPAKVVDIAVVRSIIAMQKVLDRDMAEV